MNSVARKEALKELELQKAYEEDREANVTRTKFDRIKDFFTLKEEGCENEESFGSMETRILKNPINAVPYAISISAIVYLLVLVVSALPV